MEGSYNARCPAVKRLLKEAQELHKASEEYFAQPLEDNLFEWHFTVRGPPDTEFDGGIYHGRIIMPAEYPMKPPNIIFFTPNGRFETNKKICLSISGHHPESWQPSWSIRTALLAIIGFMPSPASGTIGALNYTPAERIILAKRSAEFECTTCGKVRCLLQERTGDNKDIQIEARELFAQMTVTTKDTEENNGSDSAKDIKNHDSENESSQSPSSDVLEANSTDATATSTDATDTSTDATDTSTDITKTDCTASNISTSNSLSTQTTISTSTPTTISTSTPTTISTSTPTSISTSTPTSISTNTPTSNSPSTATSTSTSTPTSNSASVSTPTPAVTNRLGMPINSPPYLSLWANNIILCAAVTLLVALVIRRMIVFEADIIDEVEDILM